MKKLKLVLLLLVALPAVFAVAAGSASATLLWLVNNTTFEGTLPAETQGGLILVRFLSGAVVNRILCEGILDGSITNNAAEGLDEVTKVLNTLQEEVSSTQLVGSTLECTVTEDLASNLEECRTGVKLLVWLANLPWHYRLELMETSGAWLDVITGTGGEPGYEIECPESLAFFGGSELCEGPKSELVLETLEQWEGVGAFGSHGEFLDEAPLGSCGTEVEVWGFEGLSVTWAIEGELNRLETDVSHV